MKTATLVIAALTCATASTSAAPSTPATILDLTAARFAPARLSASVVLVIDAQREYVDGRLPLHEVASALHETRRLLERARAAGVPIVHVRQLSKPGRGIFDPTGPYTSFAPECLPLPGETVVTKALPNAFAGTNLDAVLHSLGRRDIVVAGYMTHMCVSATARAALDLGYRSTIVADACATRDLPDGVGGIIDASTVHRVALAELADRFATVVPTLDQLPD